MRMFHRDFFCFAIIRNYFFSYQNKKHEEGEL